MEVGLREALFFFSLCYYNMKYKVISFCVFKETGKLPLTGTPVSSNQFWK